MKKSELKKLIKRLVIEQMEPNLAPTGQTGIDIDMNMSDNEVMMNLYTAMGSPTTWQESVNAYNNFINLAKPKRGSGVPTSQQVATIADKMIADQVPYTPKAWWWYIARGAWYVAKRAGAGYIIYEGWNAVVDFFSGGGAMNVQNFDVATNKNKNI